jgi:hypothetical protein
LRISSLPPGKKAAYFIAVITHPMLAPLAGLIIFNHYSIFPITGQYFLIILSVFAISTILLPAYFVFSLKHNGAIETYEMETIAERRWPLLFTSALLCFNVYLMHRAQVSNDLQLFFLLAAVTALLAALLSQFYKISLHTIGCGFLFGICFFISRHSGYDVRSTLVILALISGVIGWSRSLLEAHTPVQIYSGFVSGLLPGFIMSMLPVYI